MIGVWSPSTTKELLCEENHLTVAKHMRSKVEIRATRIEVAETSLPLKQTMGKICDVVPILTCPEFDEINQTIEYCVFTCFQHWIDGADGKRHHRETLTHCHTSLMVLLFFKRQRIRLKINITQTIQNLKVTFRREKLATCAHCWLKSKYIFKFQHNHLQIMMHFLTYSCHYWGENRRKQPLCSLYNDVSVYDL